MRLLVVLLLLVVGAVSQTGCGPSRYSYDYEYEQAERLQMEEERRIARERKAQERRRRAQRERATQRAKAKRERERQVARVEAEPEPRESRQSERPAETVAKREPAEKPAPPRAVPPVINAPAASDDVPAAGKVAEKAAPDDEAAREAAKQQIEDGYRLLRAGFVKKARERFERAMQDSAAEASLGQGRSMDPSYLKTVAFPDVIPDAEQARRMYRRAILLGSDEAKADLERLEKALAAAAPTTFSPTSPANAAPAEPAEPPKTQ